MGISITGKVAPSGSFLIKKSSVAVAPKIVTPTNSGSTPTSSATAILSTFAVDGATSLSVSSMAYNSDGSVYVCGTVIRSTVTTGYIALLNSDFTPVWQKSIASSSTNGYNVVSVNDMAVVSASNTFLQNSNSVGGAIIACFNKAGTKQWSHSTFAVGAPGSGLLKITKALVSNTANGCLFVTGMYNDGYSNTASYVLPINTSNQTLAGSQHSIYAGDGTNTMIKSAAFDGTYAYLSGFGRVSSNSTSGYIIKTTKSNQSDGHTWIKAISETVLNTQETPDGNLCALCGGSSIKLVFLTKDGTIIKQREIKGTSTYAPINQCIDANGNVYICATKSSKIVVAKYNPTTDTTEWIRTLVSTSSGIPYSIITNGSTVSVSGAVDSNARIITYPCSNDIVTSLGSYQVTTDTGATSISSSLSVTSSSSVTSTAFDTDGAPWTDDYMVPTYGTLTGSVTNS